MSRIEVLKKNYQRICGLPWDRNVSSSQRVWFAVYDKEDERKLRLRLGLFEEATHATGHQWRLCDLTDVFATWLTSPPYTDYAESYFQSPKRLGSAIGAWWAGRQGVGGQRSEISEEGLRRQVALPDYEFEYLRFLPDGKPAAGTFEGWPKSLKDFTMLDPCCGSGHFLVEAFNLLVPMRMQDEGLSAQEACDAVLAENLFGLELDPRCTQIAAFALALAAWKYPMPRQDAWATPSTHPAEGGTGFQPQSAGGGTGFQPVSLGYRPLPPLNIACSGQSVTGKKEEWLALANGDRRLREGMSKLYDLFAQAPHLGSLIDPRREGGDLFVAGFAELQPLLEKALEKEKIQQDADATAVGVAAQGITKAAELLSTEYTLVTTNVPFLTRSKQADTLKDYCEKQHPRAKNELATAFVERCMAFTKLAGTAAFVSPQSWLFLTAYTQLRADLLERCVFDFIVKLGPAAFDDMNWWAATTMLGIVTRSFPEGSSSLAFTDVSPPRNIIQKAALLLSQVVQSHRQSSQLQNPDHRIGLDESCTAEVLGAYASVVPGFCT